MLDHHVEEGWIKPGLPDGLTWHAGDASDPDLLTSLGRKIWWWAKTSSAICPRGPLTCTRITWRGGSAPVGTCSSPLDLNVRTKAALELAWQPIEELRAESTTATVGGVRLAVAERQAIQQAPAGLGGALQRRGPNPDQPVAHLPGAGAHSATGARVRPSPDPSRVNLAFLGLSQTTPQRGLQPTETYTRLVDGRMRPPRGSSWRRLGTAKAGCFPAVSG